MSEFLGDTMKSILGGGIPGSQQKNRYIDTNSRAMDRNILRRSFGNSRILINGLKNQLSPLAYSSRIGSRSGSFRGAMNAGEVFNRENGLVTYAGNPKYVYDSSNFIRYKNLVAKNKNYNDSSYYGGNKPA